VPGHTQLQGSVHVSVSVCNVTIPFNGDSLEIPCEKDKFTNGPKRGTYLGLARWAQRGLCPSSTIP
jgi:hypothetical protein